MPNHHPYHFVPVSDQPGPDSLPLSQWDAARRGHLTHDRWSAAAWDTPSATFSGRLICGLVTETPLVIGASQSGAEDEAKTVAPYLRCGLPAIPAATLRGLISSIAEAASNSALRILGQRSTALFEAVHPNLLPLGQSGRKSHITLAELLFGFVGESADFPGQDGAFASRVTLSDARLLAPVCDAFLPQTLLADMHEPKPQSRALYLKRTGGPRGRKIYLHENPPSADRDAGARAFVAMERRRPADHLRVTPLRSGLTFFYHIDFQNLTRCELGLLIYALRPADYSARSTSRPFRHKLGLGKPLGLGTVLTAPSGLFLINRPQRYSTDSFGAPRYHAVSLWPNRNASHIPDRYEAEKEAARSLESTALPAGPQLTKLAADFRAAIFSIAPEIPTQLEQLGTPANVRRAIQYLVPGDSRFRGKTLGTPTGNPTDELPNW